MMNLGKRHPAAPISPERSGRADGIGRFGGKKMMLHPRTGAIPACQTVVAFLKCEGVVPDKTGLAQHRIYLAVAL